MRYYFRFFWFAWVSSTAISNTSRALSYNPIVSFLSQDGKKDDFCADDEKSILMQPLICDVANGNATSQSRARSIYAREVRAFDGRFRRRNIAFRGGKAPFLNLSSIYSHKADLFLVISDFDQRNSIISMMMMLTRMFSLFRLYAITLNR